MRDDVRSTRSVEQARHTADDERPGSDREVPIDGMQRDVAFWRSFEEQLSARRRTRAPAGLEARIMAAIQMEPLG
jgi:hypothetical protein